MYSSYSQVHSQNRQSKSMSVLKVRVRILNLCALKRKWRQGFKEVESVDMVKENYFRNGWGNVELLDVSPWKPHASDALSDWICFRYSSALKCPLLKFPIKGICSDTPVPDTGICDCALETISNESMIHVRILEIRVYFKIACMCTEVMLSIDFYSNWSIFQSSDSVSIQRLQWWNLHILNYEGCAS